jgi:hypothetical protein
MTPVPRVISSIDKLRRSRRASLNKTFSSVSGRINVQQLSLGGKLIFSVSSGPELGRDFTHWRFNTKAKGITASYYEIWVHYSKNDYYLDRSYFHLYRINVVDRSESEYVLLHCDACEPGDGAYSLYKQSPHIHVKAADEPLPKAHIALYNGRVNEVLGSLESFDNALKECVQLFRAEILQLS